MRIHLHAHCSGLDDLELMHEGQPSVPETLLLLHQKIEHLSKPVQALCDLAEILEQLTQKMRAMGITNEISGPPRTKTNITKW